jgi:hypothetical protein
MIQCRLFKNYVFMFGLEKFKSRKEDFPEELFVSNLNEDPELGVLVEDFKKTMQFIEEGEGDDEGRGCVTHLEKADGYDDALKRVKQHIDKNDEYTSEAIAAAVAKSMDANNHGLAGLIY